MSDNLNMTLAIPACVLPSSRPFRLIGSKDEPAICLADLCEALEYDDVSLAVTRWVARLGESRLIFLQDLKKTQSVGRPSTYRNWYVKEPEFYKVVLGSGKPNAEPVSDWVCGEVLPSIRRHGCYPAPATPSSPRTPWSQRISDHIHRFKTDVVMTYGSHRWGIGPEIMTELASIEDQFLQHGIPLRITDSPDGSVGKRWRTFREDKPWRLPDLQTIIMHLPQECGVRPHLYHRDELGHFQRWFRTCYVPVHMPEYVENKAGRDKALWLSQGRTPPTSLAIARAVDGASQRVAGRHAVLSDRLLRAAGLPAPGQPELFAPQA